MFGFLPRGTLSIYLKTVSRLCSQISALQQFFMAAAFSFSSSAWPRQISRLSASYHLLVLLINLKYLYTGYTLSLKPFTGAAPVSDTNVYRRFSPIFMARRRWYKTGRFPGTVCPHTQALKGAAYGTMLCRLTSVVFFYSRRFIFRACLKTEELPGLL